MNYHKCKVIPVRKKTCSNLSKEIFLKNAINPCPSVLHQSQKLNLPPIMLILVIMHPVKCCVGYFNEGKTH